MSPIMTPASSSSESAKPRRLPTNKVDKSQSSRASKRSTSSVQEQQPPMSLDGRHKRVWKACERCRMKKTKCDGESPCKRCKDDGLLCQAGTRRKTEYKSPPKGYAEVLENSQISLVNSVYKLYSMLRAGEAWTLGEPELNDRGQPIVHDICSRLKCVRTSPDLPPHFPETEEDLAELTKDLEALNKESESRKHSLDGGDTEDANIMEETSAAAYTPPPTKRRQFRREERASSSETDHSLSSFSHLDDLGVPSRFAAPAVTTRTQQARTTKPPRPLSLSALPSRESGSSFRSSLGNNPNDLLNSTSSSSYNSPSTASMPVSVDSPREALFAPITNRSSFGTESSPDLFEPSTPFWGAAVEMDDVPPFGYLKDAMGMGMGMGMQMQMDMDMDIPSQGMDNSLQQQQHQRGMQGDVQQVYHRAQLMRERDGAVPRGWEGNGNWNGIGAGNLNRTASPFELDLGEFQAHGTIRPGMLERKRGGGMDFSPY